ncbi:pyridoxal-dependent decarboxylase [Primorskyibacter aestuariivivens]|uniref:pyridoxal phosphate-dependent decarboxylase family protein n=1 Tax=Primorskyibacter aestuariivivens TaxID=1888912 RepID=UPI0023004D21|nr:pyridoxal-dependent decarboxylase [Primorskyibacter aestuariivivens]MDA7430299.1 pyridoxal-dependent decarboxylase [Primorskyibacter aestuariivivens]
MNQPIQNAHEETLDPQDWDAVERLGLQIMREAVAHVRDVRDRPIWRNPTEEIRAGFAAPLPRSGTALETVYGELTETLLPYPLGNIHPRYWMWYMGAGTFGGALADFLAAIDGSNLGGGNNAAALMDNQVIAWLKQMMGFPESASGTLTSGGSMANIIGLTVARNAKAGVDIREEGVAAMPQPLRYYASDQVHSCHQKGMELLGLGNKTLRRIPSGADLRMDMAALRDAIAEDRAAGYRPACVIATAGTVNTGAIDPLTEIADLCAGEDMWFHVDGCIGALIAIAPRYRHLMAGLERADSMALDPHKLLHVPFEAGCALVRDADRHRGTFAVHPEYLEDKPRGIASAEYLQDYGAQTSRGFRALKVWMTLKEHGVDKLGRLIDQNIDQTHALAALIDAEPLLKRVSDVAVDIVCFRYEPEPRMSDEALCDLNTEIMLRLQEEGIAAFSDTRVKGRHCLRVAICNHRTTRTDLELVVREICRIGAELRAETR